MTLLSASGASFDGRRTWRHRRRLSGNWRKPQIRETGQHLCNFWVARSKLEANCRSALKDSMTRALGATAKLLAFELLAYGTETWCFRPGFIPGASSPRSAIATVRSQWPPRIAPMKIRQLLPVCPLGVLSITVRATWEFEFEQPAVRASRCHQISVRHEI